MRACSSVDAITGTSRTGQRATLQEASPGQAGAKPAARDSFALLYQLYTCTVCSTAISFVYRMRRTVFRKHGAVAVIE